MFDALEEFNQVNYQSNSHNEDSNFSQEECKDLLFEKIMQVDNVEKDFGKLHLLIDNLMSGTKKDKLLL